MHPWCWHVYLQNWVLFNSFVRANVGKYHVNIRYMEHMGLYTKWTNIAETENWPGTGMIFRNCGPRGA